jgi:hypothetical protein
MPTVTPDNGVRVLLVGRSLENDSSVLTAVGSTLFATYNNGHGPANAGDFVAVTGCTTAAANAVWPVINTTSSVIEISTNIPGIVVGPGSALMIFNGARSRSVSLISSVSALATGSYQFNFTDTQPDAFEPVVSGYFFNGATGGYIIPASSTTTNVVLQSRQGSLSTAGTAVLPWQYFTISMDQIQ